MQVKGQIYVLSPKTCALNNLQIQGKMKVWLSSNTAIT